MAVLGSDNLSHSTTFKFNIDSADRVTIDSSGRLLVNATTARTNLLGGISSGYYQEGINDNVFRNISLIFGTNSAGGPLFILGKHRGTTLGANNAVLTGDELGQIIFAGSNGTNIVEGYKIAAISTANWSSSVRSAFLEFSNANGTRTALLQDDGTLRSIQSFVSQTDTGNTGFYAQRADQTLKGYLAFDNNSADIRWRGGDAVWKFAFQGDRNVVIYDGNTALFSTGTSISDIRLKENIQSTQVNGINTIKQLNVVDFTWKEDSCMCDNLKIHTGFIAQEVKEIIPDSVKILGEEDTHLIHKEELVPYLVKCIQELISKIETLETKVEQLEAI